MGCCFSKRYNDYILLNPPKYSYRQEIALENMVNYR